MLLGRTQSIDLQTCEYRVVEGVEIDPEGTRVCEIPTTDYSGGKRRTVVSRLGLSLHRLKWMERAGSFSERREPQHLPRKRGDEIREGKLPNSPRRHHEEQQQGNGSHRACLQQGKPYRKQSPMKGFKKSRSHQDTGASSHFR
jgi:hypothetical protein